MLSIYDLIRANDLIVSMSIIRSHTCIFLTHRSYVECRKRSGIIYCLLGRQVDENAIVKHLFTIGEVALVNLYCYV